MDHSDESGATVTAMLSDLTLCRVAAWGGVCGALMVPAALLVLFYLLQGSELVQPSALALTVAGVAAGIALMLLAGRIAGRLQADPAAPKRLPLRLVSTKPPGQSAA